MAGRTTFKHLRVRGPADFDVRPRVGEEPVALLSELGGGGGDEYLVYVALLSQSGSNAPVATVLKNTLGGSVVWARTGAGSYSASLSNAFAAGKTALMLGVVLPLDGQIAFGAFVRSGASVLVLNTFDVDVAGANFGPGANNADGLLVDTAVEIRVYP